MTYEFIQVYGYVDEKDNTGLSLLAKSESPRGRRGEATLETK